MTATKKIAITLCGLVGILILLCVLSRFWPFVAISFFQHGMQTRMHCWVKVVDQDGKGVAGYKCRVVEEHAPFWPFSNPENSDIVRIFNTGDDGSFEYRSKGATGRVFFGYDTRTQWRLNPTHLMQAHFLEVSSLEYNHACKENPISFCGARKNPYLIHVFSVGPPQKLLYWYRQVRLKEEHDWVCVDILSGRVWESKTPEGDIAIRDNPFTKENIKGHCVQSSVAGENCGIAPVNDDWGLEAPENGYKKELCGDRDWTGGIGVAVYYRLRGSANGQYIYGRLALTGSGRARDSLLKSYTNLQGKRNLYFKPKFTFVTTLKCLWGVGLQLM